MKWSRSDTLALALDCCARCQGMGLRGERRGTSNPCNCVLREIFRACYNRFCQCMNQEKHLSRVTLQFTSGCDGRMAYGRKDEEYCADFYLVSKRHLDESEFRIFRFHFLLGADWHLCCRKLGLDRGSFFHAVYRIERKLGRVFKELKPYGLFPLDEYFHGTTHSMEPRPKLEPTRPPLRAVAALRPPLRRAAQYIGNIISKHGELLHETD